jgi:hypothetical protein
MLEQYCVWAGSKGRLRSVYRFITIRMYAEQSGSLAQDTIMQRNGSNRAHPAPPCLLLALLYSFPLFQEPNKVQINAYHALIWTSNGSRVAARETLFPHVHKLHVGRRLCQHIVCRSCSKSDPLKVF